MSNKSNGTAFEKEFAELLSRHGFWVHRLQDNHNGQPFDVIAARDGFTAVFDCKDCQKDVFYLKRIEENQKAAMNLWGECGNHEGLFAIRFSDGEIWILSYSIVKLLEREGIKSLSMETREEYTMNFKEWMEYLDE